MRALTSERISAFPWSTAVILLVVAPLIAALVAAIGGGIAQRVSRPTKMSTFALLFAATLGVERAVAVLTEQRTALVAHLQRRRREQRAETSDDVVAAIVRDALVVRAEADLRWLDLCEARLTARKGTSR